MSLTIPQASQTGLFKQGYNSYDAEDGAVIRNVRQSIFEPELAETNLSPD
jgi:T-complex protein 1 subunit theta